MGGKVRLTILVLASCLAGSATAAPVAPEGQTVARVNGEDISETMLEVYALSKTHQPLAHLSPAVRKELLDGLINTALLAQEGNRLKSTPSLKAGRELTDMRYFSSVDVEQFMQNQKFSAQQIQAEYDQLVAVHAVQQYHLLQILLPDMATGERVRALLAQGMAFARAANVYSRDPVSGPKGGDVGWLSLTAAAPYVADADEMGEVRRIASELRVGGISEPFANSMGVHIVMPIGTQNLPLAAVKGRINEILLQQALIAYTAQLRAAAHITQLATP